MCDLVELLQRLVEIDSVNPTLVPGGAGEGAIARFVAEWLARAGLDVSVTDAAPGRPNLVGVRRGLGAGRTLLLNAHTDTVGAGAVRQPHEPVVEGGRLYGRGSYDMKAGLAAAMLAGAAVSGLAGDVVVAAVADEEAAGSGTRALCAEWSADAAIVTEPTDLDVAIAHKGFVGFELATAGRAAHGSRPEIGVDAIAAMGPVLERLADVERRLRDAPRHPLLGAGSIHASTIAGGQEYSSYPARCALRGERRTLPGESAGAVRGELDRLVRESGVDARVQVLFVGEAFEAAPGEEIVRLVHRHAGTELVGVPYWADSALIAAAGIPTVLFGPRGAGAHAAVEWVDLASVQRVRDVLVSVAREYCGGATA